MDDVSFKIRELYSKTFTLEKVKNDLFWYLNLNPNGWFVKNGSGFAVELYNETTEKCEHATIRGDDEITILKYSSFFDYETDFKFVIVIGIGKFVESKKKEMVDFFKVEKSLARLRYNHDLGLVDLEFYIWDYNKFEV